MLKKGKIIILNGVSSSGKTTLAKKIQEKSDGNFAWLSVDTFCNMWPEKVFDGDYLDAYQRIQTTMYHTIKLFSDNGIDVIADHVQLSLYHALDDLTALLQPDLVLLVHVTCPAGELRRCEEERGDRVPGQAESQLPYLIPQDTYDLTVDTFFASVDECADKIMQLADSPEQWTAFKKLCLQASIKEPDGADRRRVAGKQDNLSEIIEEQTERALWEAKNVIDCVPDTLWNREYCDMPCWKHIYHMLHSLDLWYINPKDHKFREPAIHEKDLNNLDIVSDRVLSRNEIDSYFACIEKKIRAYVSGLTDEQLLEYPADCDYSKFTLILAQFRHLHSHMGMVMGFIIEDTGLWPRVLGLENPFPEGDYDKYL